MEFKQYLKILKANTIIITAFTILGIILAVVFSAKTNYPYKQTQLIFLQTRQESVDQDYSGYYSQEKARNFTDTAVSILNSINFQSESSLGTASVNAKKLAPQLIQLTALSQNNHDQNELITKVVEILNSKMKDVSEQSAIEAKQISTLSPSTHTAPSRKVITVAGLLGGFIFALCIISVKTYFRL